MGRSVIRPILTNQQHADATVATTTRNNFLLPAADPLQIRLHCEWHHTLPLSPGIVLSTRALCVSHLLNALLQRLPLQPVRTTVVFVIMSSASPRGDDTENIHPNTAHPTSAASAASSSADSSSSSKGSNSSSPTSSSSASAPISSSTPACAKPPAKKRKKSASAPRTLTKEELADYIARDEFWQASESEESESLVEDDDEPEPIYDDCNDIRRKIKAFLRTGRMTQTAWLKLIGCNCGPYLRFMKQEGPGGGCHNSVYPAAAHFFDSLRILERKPKSAKRLKEEADARSRRRRSTATVMQGGEWCGGAALQSDELGLIRGVVDG